MCVCVCVCVCSIEHESQRVKSIRCDIRFVVQRRPAPPPQGPSVCMCVCVTVCMWVCVVCVCVRFGACDIRQHIIWVILGQTKIRLEPCSRFPDPLIELNYTWALSPLTRPPSHMRALGQFTKLKENYVLGTSSSLFWNLESQIDKMGIAGVGKIKWIGEGISILHHLSDIPLGMLMVP